jgi:pyruvate, orthophosphate dikinase
MFLGDRLPLVQRMILADDEDEERAALAELQAVQRADFVQLFEAMDGLPVTVRLLDPPLHEFLPHVVDLALAEARGELDSDGRRLLAAARSWEETNPMLGTRGCRLAIVKPSLYRMQTRALVEAAVEAADRGCEVRLEIMIPLVASAEELSLLAGWVREEASTVLTSPGRSPDFTIGTMIETPRAALQAGSIAWSASFFSFGTNDLTQMTFGLSRDDAEGRLLPRYMAEGIFRVNPFESIDPEGVGRLMRMAVTEGLASQPDLHLGVCGEHGGDPRSVAFFHELGVDYVSCSPYRVPIARLAAAHAALGVEPTSAGA